MTQPDSTTPPADEAPKVDPPAKPETDWKAEARKHEQRAKENADKARQFDALQEATKTEQQRQAEALETTQRELAAAASRALRYEVAAEAGLDFKLVKFLPSGSKEEMQQAAEELLHATVLKASGPKPDPSQGPKATKALSGADAGRAEAQRRFGTSQK